MSRHDAYFFSKEKKKEKNRFPQNIRTTLAAPAAFGLACNPGIFMNITFFSRCSDPFIKTALTLQRDEKEKSDHSESRLFLLHVSIDARNIMEKVTVTGFNKEIFLFLNRVTRGNKKEDV